MNNLYPLLIFSRSREIIYLQDRISGQVIFSFPAHNRTEKPYGNPLEVGSWGPAPFGFLTVSPPDFISDEFRKEFMRAHFGNSISFPGESLVQGWGEFERNEMGRVRFILGSPDAPLGFADRSCWEREILIHGGRPFNTLTKGCIRMGNEDLERLAYQWILFYRMGYQLNILLNSE